MYIDIIINIEKNKKKKKQLISSKKIENKKKFTYNTKNQIGIITAISQAADTKIIYLEKNYVK